MRNDKRSWRNTVFQITGIILVFLIIMIIAVMSSYQMQMNRAYQAEDKRIVQAWEKTMESRLDSIHSHIYELALTLYNNTELKTGSPSMSFVTRKKIVDTATEKVDINEDIDCVFIYNKDTEDLIFSTGNSTKLPVRLFYHAKEFVQEGIYPTISVHQRQWSVVRISEEPAFIQVMNLGKYLVGSISMLSHYDIENSFQIMRNHYSCDISVDGDVFHIAGEKDLTHLSMAEDGDVVPDDSAVEVLTQPFSLANAKLHLSVSGYQNAHMYSAAVIWIVVSGGVTVLLILYLMAMLSQKVSRPVVELLEATHEIQSGNLDYQISEDQGSTEFDTLSASFNHMTHEIKNLKIQAYDMELEKKRDELSMLRAQIQPHFYLNAITTINNMTYQDRNADIRTYVQALAKFMRYMLNLRSKMISISDEITHIQNYLKMQSIKFPNSVHATVTCEDSVKDIEIPYLLIFTVVENAFKHAMDLYHPLELTIDCFSVQRGWGYCGIRVTDNGKGFPQEVLEMFHPGTTPTDAKEHLGLTNISRTLKLVYDRDDLLTLSNLPQGGGCVELMIPFIYDHSRLENEHEIVDL